MLGSGASFEKLTTFSNLMISTLSRRLWSIINFFLIASFQKPIFVTSISAVTDMILSSSDSEPL